MFYSGDFPYVNLYQRVIDVNSYLGCVYYLISPIYCGTWGMYGIPSSDGHGKLGITMILNVYPCDLPNIDLAVGRCREMEDDIFSWKNGLFSGSLPILGDVKNNRNLFNVSNAIAEDV